MKYIGAKSCKVFLPWLWAGIVCAFYLGIGRIYFDTNDDAGIVEIVSGARSAQWRAHLIYCNVLFGHFLAFLYGICHCLNWFVMMQCILSFCCLVCINGYILHEKGGNRRLLICLCLLIDVVIGEFHFFRFQYTHNAWLYVCVGMFLLLHADGLMRRMVLGGLLVLSGALVRWDALLPVLPMVLLLLSYQWMMGVKFVKRATLAVTITVFLCGCCHAIDLRAYGSPEWRDYQRRCMMRTEIQDYSVGIIDANKMVFEEIAGSKNELEIVRHWLVGDEAVMEESRLASIIEEARRLRPSLLKINSLGRLLYTTVKTMLGILFGWRLGLMILGGAVILLYVKSILPTRPGGNQFSICQLIYSHGVLIALSLGLVAYGLIIHGYLIYSLERCIFRAFYGYWLFLLLALLPLGVNVISLDSMPKAFHRSFCVVALLLMMPSLGSSAVQTLRYRFKFNPMLARYRQMLEILNQDKESIYLFTNGWVAAHNAYHPLITPSIVPGENSLFLSGWDVPSPRALAHRWKLGMEQPFLELAKCRKELFLMGDYPSIVVAYLNEHYGNDFSLQKEREIAGFPVWRVVREQTQAKEVRADGCQ